MFLLTSNCSLEMENKMITESHDKLTEKIKNLEEELWLKNAK